MLFKIAFCQIFPLYCIPFGLWLVGTSWVLSGEGQCFFLLLLLLFYYYYYMEVAVCTNP